MKIGIVVPFSWSFWGAVVEHAELQAAALEELGHDVRLIMGNDPPGQFTRVLHPRVGRHGEPPANVVPVGRSVIVPANGSLPNIVLSPRRVRPDPPRARARALRRAPSARADDARRSARRRSCSRARRWWRRSTPRATSDGCASARRSGASSSTASTTGSRSRSARGPRRSAGCPGEYEVIPNGVLVPDAAPAGDREHRIVFAGRQEPRKGLHVLLAAWPEIHRRIGLAAHRRGRGSARGPAAPRPAARAGRRHRRRRLPEPGGAHATRCSARRRWSRRRSGRRASGWC